MHQIFITNPDLLDFCVKTGIFNQINTWLESGLHENYDKAVKLIKVTNRTAGSENSNFKSNSTLIIGNGDVIDYEDGVTKARDSGVEGVMIGRGIFKNPWAFLPREQQLEFDTKENRLRMLLEHLEMWNNTWGDIKTLKKIPEFKRNSPENVNIKNFASMKKFVKMYISNFAGALDLRVQFMDLNTCDEMIVLCKKVLKDL